ncbi:MAG: Vms1/Ankzf1 family peptidyl-tRNA hydrolase [Dehalococcoidia bacterium]|nr:Vms1/Ankzf1 family peptidyl-tRNA hydrolase [Dehalococcoidia bacterium]
MELTGGNLKRLAALHSDDGIFSVYIKIDPVLGYDLNQPVAKFKGALKRFQRDADEHARAILEREKEKVLAYLKAWEPHGRGLAIFSSQPANIWETFELGVTVMTWVSAGTTPQTAVLAQVLEDYPRLAVLLLDGESARIYTGERREWERGASVSSDVPGRHDQGGWAQARFQRHIEFHEAQHLKKVARELDKLYEDKPFNRLVVAGAEAALDELQAHLHKGLVRRLAGRLPADFKQESDSQILERATVLAADAERISEERLVEQIIEEAGAGAKAVVGFEDTIKAVTEDRVQTLVVADGVVKEGAVCPGCHYFASEAFDCCPACGSTAEPVPDIVEYATERMLLRGGGVEVVSGRARDWLMSRGGLGAVLRYKVATTA